MKWSVLGLIGRCLISINVPLIFVKNVYFDRKRLIFCCKTAFSLKKWRFRDQKVKRPVPDPVRWYDHFWAPFYMPLRELMMHYKNLISHPLRICRRCGKNLQNVLKIDGKYVNFTSSKYLTSSSLEVYHSKIWSIPML